MQQNWMMTIHMVKSDGLHYFYKTALQTLKHCGQAREHMTGQAEEMWCGWQALITITHQRL